MPKRKRGKVEACWDMPKRSFKYKFGPDVKDKGIQEASKFNAFVGVNIL
jgi:hypothetical protein